MCPADSLHELLDSSDEDSSDTDDSSDAENSSLAAGSHVASPNSPSGSSMGVSRRARRGSVFAGRPKLRSRRATLRKSIRLNRKQMRHSLIRGDSSRGGARRVKPRVYLPVASGMRAAWKHIATLVDGTSLRLLAQDGEIQAVLAVESLVWDAEFDSTLNRWGRRMCCGSFGTWRRWNPKIGLHTDELALPYVGGGFATNIFLFVCLFVSFLFGAAVDM